MTYRNVSKIECFDKFVADEDCSYQGVALNNPNVIRSRWKKFWLQFSDFLFQSKFAIFIP